MPDLQTKTALITGITGQDGAYLSEILLAKGYRVHGVQRRSSLPNTERIVHLKDKGLVLHYGDMTDSFGLYQILNKVAPDEVYNLAAQSHVHVSFDKPEYTANADGLGALRLLESIRHLGAEKEIRFFQASTSELFGNARTSPQSETTPFYPRSPYGVAKLYAYWMVVNYREAYGIFASNGIMFNHESPIRGEEFVTRKVTKAVAEIAHGQRDCLMIGNLDASRDWGHARDYMEGVWRILQHDRPDDFVLATGTAHTVRELITLAFSEVGIGIEWSGKGHEEIGRHSKTGDILVRVDPSQFRPTEVDALLGDASKAKEILNWTSTTSFRTLIQEMVERDLESVRRRAA